VIAKNPKAYDRVQILFDQTLRERLQEAGFNPKLVEEIIEAFWIFDGVQAARSFFDWYPEENFPIGTEEFYADVLQSCEETAAHQTVDAERMFADRLPQDDEPDGFVPLSVMERVHALVAAHEVA
jgi:hypothetical protein